MLSTKYTKKSALHAKKYFKTRSSMSLCIKTLSKTKYCATYLLYWYYKIHSDSMAYLQQRNENFKIRNVHFITIKTPSLLYQEKQKQINITETEVNLNLCHRIFTGVWNGSIYSWLVVNFSFARAPRVSALPFVYKHDLEHDTSLTRYWLLSAKRCMFVYSYKSQKVVMYYKYIINTNITDFTYQWPNKISYYY